MRPGPNLNLGSRRWGGAGLEGTGLPQPESPLDLENAAPTMVDFLYWEVEGVSLLFLSLPLLPLQCS